MRSLWQRLMVLAGAIILGVLIGFIAWVLLWTCVWSSGTD